MGKPAVINFTAAKPIPAEVLSMNDNGSGVVRIPILPASIIDLSLTSGGGKGTLELTKADLQQIADNFKRYPGPIPCSVQPHREFEGYAGASPMFIEGMSVKGEILYGDLFMIAPLMYEFMEGVWRGFSVDLHKDMELPTAKLDGWSVPSGVLTNRPATDVHFRVPDGARPVAAERLAVALEIRPPEGNRKESMPEKTAEDVARLEAQIQAKADLAKQLEADLKAAQTKEAEVRAELAEATAKLTRATDSLENEKAAVARQKRATDDLEKRFAALEKGMAESKTKLQEAEDRNTAREVLEIANAAVKKGADGAMFENIEDDPVAWLQASFGGNLEGMRNICEALPKRKTASVSSNPFKKDADKDAVSDETRAALEAHGIDPTFAGCRTMADVRKRKAELAKK